MADEKGDYNTFLKVKDRWRNAYSSIKQNYLDLADGQCDSQIMEYILNINPDAIDKKKNPFIKKYVNMDPA